MKRLFISGAAAAVGAEFHLLREQCGEAGGDATGDGRVEGFQQPLLAFPWRLMAHLACGQAAARAGHQLAAGRFLHADGALHVRVVQVEDVVQQALRLSVITMPEEFKHIELWHLDSVNASNHCDGRRQAYRG